MRAMLIGVAVALLLAPAASGSGSGIRGRVTSSPTCPVETMPPQPQCAPRGLRARIRITRNGAVVKRLTTDADGRFSVTLRAGGYKVLAQPVNGGSLPRCPGAQAVRVRSGRFARVAIDCDSGIR
jgi:hypothetical protein